MFVKKLKVLVAFLSNEKIGRQLGFLPLFFFLKVFRLKLKKKGKGYGIRLYSPYRGADLRFLALHPGSAMEGWGPAILCFRTPFLFTFPRFLQVPI